VMWVMSNLVSVRLETVLVSVQDGAWFAPNVEIILEIILILTQNRCMVCAECTIGLKSFWTHPMELIDDMAHVEPR
jgi:hypothetical protein